MTSHPNLLFCLKANVSLVTNGITLIGRASPAANLIRCLLWEPSKIDGPDVTATATLLCCHRHHTGELEKNSVNVIILLVAYFQLYRILTCTKFGSFTWWRTAIWENRVRCHHNAVNFLSNPHKIHPFHSSPVGTRYGMYFVGSNFDLYSASFTAVMYVISHYFGLRYNGTWLQL